MVPADDGSLTFIPDGDARDLLRDLLETWHPARVRAHMAHVFQPLPF